MTGPRESTMIAAATATITGSVTTARPSPMTTSTDLFIPSRTAFGAGVVERATGRDESVRGLKSAVTDTRYPLVNGHEQLEGGKRSREVATLAVHLSSNPLRC